MKTNKILKISGIAAMVVVVLVLLSFVGSIRTSALCDDVLVQFEDSSDVVLITKDEVRAKINGISGNLVGVPLNKIDTKNLEEQIAEMPQVSQVKVFKTIDKKLIVSLQQRNPIARYIDKDGASALLSDCGTLMPVMHTYPSRLPVISGAFSIPSMTAGKADSVRTDLYRYANAIASSSFWTAQIQHTIYDAAGEFEAYPQVGKHTIAFGKSENIDTKLAKLKIFYAKGITEANWNKFSRINLKYQDQIVCTKK